MSEDSCSQVRTLINFLCFLSLNNTFCYPIWVLQCLGFKTAIEWTIIILENTRSMITICEVIYICVWQMKSGILM